MPTRNGKRTRPVDDEIERILREAEEVLREVQAPSGDWFEPQPGGSELGAAWGSGAGEGSGRETGFSSHGAWPGIGDHGIDAEAAFWLLFPPRGNA
jgi:hypothetical protein